MRSLRTQLMVSMVSVSALSGALAGVPLYLEATSVVEEILVAHLASVAETAVLAIPVAQASQIGGDGPVPLEVNAWLGEVQEEAAVRDAWLVGRNGRVITRHSARKSTARDEAALAIAWEGDPGWTPIYSDPNGTSIQTAYAPIDFDDDGVEDAALGIEGEVYALDRLTRLRQLFLIGAVAALGILALGVLIASRRIVAPIEALATAAAMLARGDRPQAPAPASTTEIETLRATFVAMAEAVRQREAWLRSLAGAVAHEVRNPANGAKLQMGLLRRDLSVASAGVLGRLATIEGELDQLEQIVASFVAFARQGTVVRRPVMLQTWLRTAALDATAVSADPEEVYIDPVLLGRAVTNLVQNAHQAGGRPIVRAEIADDRLHISVSDDGRGFPPDLLARAFEPFATGRPDGTGLGLAVVEAIVRAHGGQVAIPRPGPGGTEVVLVIPVERGGDLPDRKESSGAGFVT